jgi:hypothetical protein
VYLAGGGGMRGGARRRRRYRGHGQGEAACSWPQQQPRTTLFPSSHCPCPPVAVTHPRNPRPPFTPSPPPHTRARRAIILGVAVCAVGWCHSAQQCVDRTWRGRGRADALPWRCSRRRVAEWLAEGGACGPGAAPPGGDLHAPPAPSYAARAIVRRCGCGSSGGQCMPR